MPKHWLYYLALIVPLIIRLLVIDLGLAEWFWYRGNSEMYQLFNHLRSQPQFMEFIGGWALPIFVVTVGGYWHMDDETDHASQFLLLPLLYIPFTILVNVVTNHGLNPDILLSHPVLIILFGYLYVLAWIFFIWVFQKLRLVI
ncbi:MAG: hypothetical protein SFT92_08595 [Rickettsiales bacterium]|nr:hypothetical protein [Rickettsiales bacterium]